MSLSGQYQIIDSDCAVHHRTRPHQNVHLSLLLLDKSHYRLRSSFGLVLVFCLVLAYGLFSTMTPAYAQWLPDRPWTANTRFPSFIAGGVGLLISSVGMFGNSQQSTSSGDSAAHPVVNPWGMLFFGGVSVMSSSLAALMLQREPPLWQGVVSNSLTFGLALSGSLLVSLSDNELAVAMGWGFIASLPIHLLFNILGWINYANWRKWRKWRDPPTTQSITHSWISQIQIAPAVIPSGIGLGISGTF